MEAESRRSRWARRGVLLAAALASMATSPARWNLDAKIPQGGATSTTGQHITVEASHEPGVSARRRGETIQILREDQAPWTGRGTYYLPPDVEPTEVFIGGTDCSSGGGMCSTCQPPTGAFVRVTKVDPVAPWSLTRTGDEQTARVTSREIWTAYDVLVEGTAPVELEAVLSDGDRARLRPTVMRERTDGSSQKFTVSWSPTTEDAGLPIEVRWTPRVTIYGFCATGPTCQPPEGAVVKVLSVTGRPR